MVYDTQVLCADVFVAMAAAAVHTRRIHLGTGVLIPSNRIAPVAANALASLNKLVPARTWACRRSVQLAHRGRHVPAECQQFDSGASNAVLPTIRRVGEGKMA